MATTMVSTPERNEMLLSDDVKEILEERVIIEGDALKIVGKLERKLYERVNKALELLGGKWSRKAQAHLFEGGAGDVVADAVATGAVVDHKKEFQFFETPDDVAARLVAMADVRPGQAVLEPSAGRGRIVVALRRGGVEPVACELWDKNREVLRALGVEVLCDDFFNLDPTRAFDRIVANPPFSRQQDVAHVRRMWDHLRPGGRLVSVMSPAWSFRTHNPSRDFRAFVELMGGRYVSLAPGSFSASGTEVNAGIMVLDKPEA